MSQHDFNIANQTFPSFRADLNDALVAAATMSAGSSAPTTPYAYQLWFDTTTSTWKVRNSGNTAWISTITTDLATGNVGIGTSSPESGYKLHINGDLLVDGDHTGSGGNNFEVRADPTNITQFVVRGDGNVGIGTSSPATTLDIDGTLTITGTAGRGLTITSATSSTGQGDADAVYDAQDTEGGGTGSHIFKVGGSEKARINGSGTLFLGNSTHEWSGSMRAQIDGSKGLAVFSSGGSASEVIACWNRGNSGTRYQMWFADSTSQGLRGSITTNGSSTSYNTTSDYRLKENVTADWDATTRLKQLNPVRFNFIADADTTVDGFLAHEVQGIVPEAISGTKDGMRDEEYQVSAATGDIYTPAVAATYDEDGVELTAAVDEVIHSADVERPEVLAEGQQWRETTAAVMGTRSVPDFQGIDQSKLVPLLVKTIQELEARITALEAS